MEYAAIITKKYFINYWRAYAKSKRLGNVK